MVNTGYPLEDALALLPSSFCLPIAAYEGGRQGGEGAARRPLVLEPR